ncbi:hypothetical protein J1N10_06635 [Carboxylicivirga sp. A043]|nr:hypothetical protein [Carboxylicivirga sp. A043]
MVTCFVILKLLIVDNGGFANNLTQLDSLLVEIDEAINSQAKIIKQKEDFIRKIKAQLGYTNLPQETRYILYKQLTDEYITYQADSSLKYARLRTEAAATTGNEEWITDSRIHMALVQAKSGFFQAAIDTLKKMDISELNENQRMDYYIAYSDTYVYWMEFSEGMDISDLVVRRSQVQDSLINILQPGSYEYAVHKGTKNIEAGNYEEAKNLLLSAYPKLTHDTRQYAVLTSLLAYLFEQQGNVQERKVYLALSALADIESGIMENTSLRTLALLLYKDGDLQRANSYIKKCLDDANFFNARLRNLQTSRILPIIDKAYQEYKVAQEKKLSNLLHIISMLLVLLVLVVVFVIRQMFKLSKAQKSILLINNQLSELNVNLKQANIQQIETNKSLADANYIKEQFISNFLEICTEYIDKLEKLKSSIRMKIKAGQVHDVLRMTDSPSDTAEELKELYENFDRAFLNIYPNFIEEFNKLLKNDKRYKEPEDGSLNQELRIFALIRLGITDNNQMATFLHYTLRTIYNYRSKVKSKATHPDDNFEEQVKQLCS